MRANEFISEAILDPRGWGGTPYGTDIDYFGLRVQMKPSTFLKLALPLGSAQTNPEVEKHMSAGGKIAYPMLDIEIPENWKDGDYSKPAEVVDHEGRNRMTQWIKLKGDDPIQVNIRPRGGLRRKNLSDDYIEALSKGLVSQRGNYISNPFSADTVLENSVNTTENSYQHDDHITLRALYGDALPERNERFWDEIRKDELEIPLQIKTLPSYKIEILLRGQYRIEHLDELLDLLDADQHSVLERYRADPRLSQSIIVLSGGRIIDGNHRALAAALNRVSIRYVDLADLEEQEITESFDRPYKLKWERGMHGDWDAGTILDDGGHLVIMFNNEYKKSWMVEFWRNSDQGITNEGDALRIFATVLTAIKQFIQKKKPQSLFFSSIKKDDPKGSRTKLYDRLIQRYIGDLGYTIRREEHSGQVAYKLIRNQQSVAENKSAKKINFKLTKGKNKFSTTMMIDDSEAGIYQYDSNSGRSIAEVFPEFKGQGFGKILVLNAIYTAAKLGMDFIEDESRTAEYDNVLDSLSENGYIVSDDGYLYITSEGEKHLKQAISLDEMALQTYKTMGDFSKPGPFTGADKKLVPHPKNIEKATQFFEQTPFDFRLFFSHLKGTGKYSEHGPMSIDQIRQVFGKDADEIIAGSEDAITVIYVGNKGESKVMLTPWMMAHRFGHAIAAGNRNADKRWGPWREAEEYFFGQINNLLNTHYNKSKLNQFSSPMNYKLTPEYNALFNAIGTQLSSKSGQIRRPYEFLYEIFAQYLGTGKITLNPLPTNLDYGRKAWGNPTKYMNIKPEYRSERERKNAADTLAYTMELLFNDVLSDSVGKIFVM